jgi:hypothetical protein
MTRWNSNSMYSYSSAGVPFAKEGLGTDTVWLGGGRIGAGIAAHGGIEKIIYYGRQTLGRAAFFGGVSRSAYAKIFKPYLLVDEKAYRLELTRTHIYPGGYRSTFRIPEERIEVEHDLVLVNDAILQTVRVIRNPGKKRLRLRISWHEYTRLTPEGRTWGPWTGKMAPNTWALRIADPELDERATDTMVTIFTEKPLAKEKAGTTWFGVVGEKPLTTRLMTSGRRYFETGTFVKGSITISALFGHDRTIFRKRATTLSRAGSKESAAMLASWEKKLADFPRLQLGIPAVESFFQLLPLLQESLMPGDLPGGMRASAGTYWVWGWDTLVFCEAYLAAGQANFLRDALDLYHRTAHPTEGVGHQFSTEMETRIAQAPAAQGLYVYALYQYVAYTGDRHALKRHYPLVLTILKLAQGSRHPQGYFSGKALFPDLPEYAGHNGHDLSVFNNSIFYQAARTIEHLAGWMKDPATAQIARTYWQDLKKAFDRFWDKESGYWFDSLDSRNLSPRREHPSHALLCFSPFANELLVDRSAACSRFMAKHLVYANALRMYPLESKAFNGDGNQLGQHYPVGGDLLFLKSSALEGRQDLLERWLDWMKQFWEQNTVPEGVTVEAENEGPQYPDEPGGKQPFSGKAWYMGIIHAILGVHFDAGGLTFNPGLDRPVEIDRIKYGGRYWNIRTRGKGTYIQRLRVNGREISGTCKIPADVAGGKVMNVEVSRGSKPTGPFQLLSADGAKVSRWRSGPSGFRFRLDSPGPVSIRFYASKKPVVKWRGQIIPCSYAARTGQGSMLLAADDYVAIKGDLVISSS